MNSPLLETAEKKLERCGFCGRYFIEDQHLLSEEIQKYTQEELEAAPHGYCPDAMGEACGHKPDHMTTQDFIDAGYMDKNGNVL